MCSACRARRAWSSVRRSPPGWLPPCPIYHVRTAPGARLSTTVCLRQQVATARAEHAECCGVHRFWPNGVDDQLWWLLESARPTPNHTHKIRFAEHVRKNFSAARTEEMAPLGAGDFFEGWACKRCAGRRKAACACKRCALAHSHSSLCLVAPWHRLARGACTDDCARLITPVRRLHCRKRLYCAVARLSWRGLEDQTARKSCAVWCSSCCRTLVWLPSSHHPSDGCVLLFARSFLSRFCVEWRYRAEIFSRGSALVPQPG